MKRIVATLVILSLFLLGCSTEIVEEDQSIEEQIDEAQAIVDEAMEEATPELIVEEPKSEDVIEEPVLETNAEELIVENAEIDTTIEEEEEEEEETSTGTTHLIQVNLKGFDPSTITIKAGDSIQWENVRSGNLNKAMIVGSSPCTKAKSAILMPGETYSWTFNDPVKCVFTDAITITQLMKVIVE